MGDVPKLSTNKDYMSLKPKHLLSQLTWLLFGLLCLNASPGYCNTLLPGHDYYISASDVRIRTVPGVEAEVIGKLQRGTVVTVVKVTQEWVEIRTKDGRGYVKASFLGRSKPLVWQNTTFSKRFSTGFGIFFIPLLIGMGALKKRKDARFKTGYRSVQPTAGEFIALIFRTVLICSIIGLITGIAGFF